MQLARTEAVDYDGLSDVQKHRYVSRAMRQIGPEHHGRQLARTEGADYDGLSDEQKHGYVNRAMGQIGASQLARTEGVDYDTLSHEYARRSSSAATRKGWAGMNDVDRDARLRQLSNTFQLGYDTRL